PPRTRSRSVRQFLQFRTGREDNLCRSVWSLKQGKNEASSAGSTVGPVPGRRPVQEGPVAASGVQGTVAVAVWGRTAPRPAPRGVPAPRSRKQKEPQVITLAALA